MRNQMPLKKKALLFYLLYESWSQPTLEMIYGADYKFQSNVLRFNDFLATSKYLNQKSYLIFLC